MYYSCYISFSVKTDGGVWQDLHRQAGFRSSQFSVATLNLTFIGIKCIVETLKPAGHRNRSTDA